MNFQTSVNPDHKRILQKLNLDLPIHRIRDGIDEVMKDPKLAFLIESSQADIVKQTHCDLVTTGHLATKFYGLVFPKGSKLVDPFNKALIALGEDGTISALRAKWFNDRQNCSNKVDNHSNDLVEGSPTGTDP